MATVHRIKTVVRQLPGRLRREAPRPIEHRQPEYDERFDHTTLFSGAFVVQDGLELLGPPLLNLRADLTGATFIVDGVTFGGEVLMEDKHRISRTILRGIKHANEVVVDFPHEGTVSLPVSQPISGFDNRRVLVTQQQNNPIEWIRFWARFHAVQHGVDAVVVYDNFSTVYGSGDLEDALCSIPELTDVAVIDWRVPFGVTGGPANMWDSDFGQHQQLEHAMRYVLADAACVVQGDVDELVIADNGASVCDMLIDSSVAELRYPRRGVGVTVLGGHGMEGHLLGHEDFGYFDPVRPLQMPKYSVVPSRVHSDAHYLVHGVDGVPRIVAEGVYSRHYSALRVDWRKGALEPISINSAAPPASSFVLDVAAVEQTKYVRRLDNRSASTVRVRPHLGIRSVDQPEQVQNLSVPSRYALSLNESMSLELLLDPKISDQLIVSFHGALDRSKCSIQCFERRDTIASHDASGLYFSDPLLSRSPELEAAWFEGGEELGIIESAVAVTKRLANDLGAAKVIYSGSSSGGFAALQASALHDGSLALTFNPVTAIGNHTVDSNSCAAQRAYVAAVWPEAYVSMLGQTESLLDFESLTSPRTSALKTYESPRMNHVLMCINVNDPHFGKHYLPFLAAAARGNNLARVHVFEYDGPPAHGAPSTAEFDEGLKRGFDLMDALDLRVLDE